MTGRLRTLTTAKKFWPRRARAVAEGLVDAEEALIDLIAAGRAAYGDLAITDPADGTEQTPLFAMSGSGARPDTDVDLYDSGRVVGADEPNATVTADENGEFIFDGDHASALGDVGFYVACEFGPAQAGVTEISPIVRFTVVEA